MNMEFSFKRNRPLLILAAALLFVAIGTQLRMTDRDCRQVLLEGFSVGAKPGELKEQLGPPSLVNGTWQWSIDDRVLKFWRGCDGFHLSGKQIKIGERTLSYGSKTSLVQALLGPGELVSLPDGTRGLRYSPPFAGHDDKQNLTVHLFSMPQSTDKPVFEFELFWAADEIPTPEIYGYAPSSRDYATYPDGQTDAFSCNALKFNKEKLIDYSQTTEDVARILGRPVLTTRHGELWGFWQCGLPDKQMGLLISFIDAKVSSIVVSRDWEVLAAEISNHHSLLD